MDVEFYHKRKVLLLPPRAPFCHGAPSAAAAAGLAQQGEHSALDPRSVLQVQVQGALRGLHRRRRAAPRLHRAAWQWGLASEPRGAGAPTLCVAEQFAEELPGACGQQAGLAAELARARQR